MHHLRLEAFIGEKPPKGFHMPGYSSIFNAKKKKKKKKVPLLEGIGIEFSVPIARDPDHEV